MKTITVHNGTKRINFAVDQQLKVTTDDRISEDDYIVDRFGGWHQKPTWDHVSIDIIDEKVTAPDGTVMKVIRHN